MAKQVKQKNGKITLGPAPVYSTIEKGCNAFGLSAEKIGFIVKAGAWFRNAPKPDPALKDVSLWFPNVNHNHWVNIYQPNTITEGHKNPLKNNRHVQNLLNNPELRIVFMKDEKSWKGYKFVGVYELDLKRTKSQNKCVWKQIPTITCIHSDLREVKQHLQSNHISKP